MKKGPVIKILFIGIDGSIKSSIIVKLKGLKDGEIVKIYPIPFIKCTQVTYTNKILNCIEVSGLKRYRKVRMNFTMK